METHGSTIFRRNAKPLYAARRTNKHPTPRHTSEPASYLMLQSVPSQLTRFEHYQIYKEQHKQIFALRIYTYLKSSPLLLNMKCSYYRTQRQQRSSDSTKFSHGSWHVNKLLIWTCSSTCVKPHYVKNMERIGTSYLLRRSVQFQFS